MSIVEAIRYTIKDVRVRKNLADYVNSILIYSKNVGLALTETKQVLLAYEHMNAELRRDLPRPLETSTIPSLINELRLQKDIWYDIYSKHDSKSFTDKKQG